MRIKINNLGELRKFLNTLKTECGFDIPYDYGDSHWWYIVAKKVDDKDKNLFTEVSGLSIDGTNETLLDLMRVAIEKGLQDLIPIIGVEIGSLDTGFCIKRNLSNEEYKRELERFKFLVM